MTDNQFSISKTERYYIYGYTKKGREIACFLHENGYSVEGFIDRNADKLSKQTMDKIFWAEDITINKESVIIVSCQNIGTQHQVAEYLYQQGYSKLIFMAAGRHYPKKYAEQIREAWECLSEMRFPESLRLLPYRRQCFNLDTEVVLRNMGNSVIAWIPMELLYTKTRKQSIEEFRERGILNDLNLERIKGTNDEPVVCSESLTAFFDFVLLNKGNCSKYMEIYADFSCHEINQHVLDRLSLVRIWDEELEHGIQYFVDAAVRAVWNSKGYFNVIDGLHRSMYLFYRGFIKIPVMIKKEDFQSYFHSDIADYFADKTRKLSLAHPLFYDRFFDKKERSRLYIALIRYLKRVGWDKLGFLDIGAEDGYLAVSMKHFGARNVGCLAQENNMEVLRQGAELVYAKDIIFFEKNEWEKINVDVYDVVYVRDSQYERFKELSLKNFKYIFYDRKKDVDTLHGEIIYAYFDDAGDARDVVVIRGE